MHLTSFLLLLASTAVFASPYPVVSEKSTTIEPRAAAGANSTTTGPKGAKFACDHSNVILSQQVAEMAKLKEANIGIPPYLAGYYSAINSGHQAIGCPAINVAKPQSQMEIVPLQEPCDVINEQHGRMMVLINRFQKDSISVAPYIAGFVSATVDGNKGLGCPPFTPSAADAPVDSASAADSDSSA